MTPSRRLSQVGMDLGLGDLPILKPGMSTLAGPTLS